MYPHRHILDRGFNDRLLTTIFSILIKWNIDKRNHKADFTTTNKSIHTLLSQAIERGYTRLSKLLLMQGFDVSPIHNKDFNEMPALTVSASTGNLEIIEEFVKLNLEKIFYYENNNCNPICAAINT